MTKKEIFYFNLLYVWFDFGTPHILTRTQPKKSQAPYLLCSSQILKMVKVD